MKTKLLLALAFLILVSGCIANCPDDMRRSFKIGCEHGGGTFVLHSDGFHSCYPPSDSQPPPEDDLEEDWASGSTAANYSTNGTHQISNFTISWYNCTVGRGGMGYPYYEYLNDTHVVFYYDKCDLVNLELSLAEVASP